MFRCRRGRRLPPPGARGARRDQAFLHRLARPLAMSMLPPGGGAPPPSRRAACTGQLEGRRKSGRVRVGCGQIVLSVGLWPLMAPQQREAHRPMRSRRGDEMPRRNPASFRPWAASAPSRRGWARTAPRVPWPVLVSCRRRGARLPFAPLLRLVPLTRGCPAAPGLGGGGEGGGPPVEGAAMADPFPGWVGAAISPPGTGPWSRLVLRRVVWL